MAYGCARSLVVTPEQTPWWYGFHDATFRMVQHPMNQRGHLMGVPVARDALTAPLVGAAQRFGADRSGCHFQAFAEGTEVRAPQRRYRIHGDWWDCGHQSSPPNRCGHRPVVDLQQLVQTGPQHTGDELGARLSLATEYARDG
jgi:hypothetical protein